MARNENGAIIMSQMMKSFEKTACQQALEYGVDLSIIRENLRLTVMERLQRHQSALNTALELQRAIRQAHDRPSQTR
jgi:hypothetical protein